MTGRFKEVRNWNIEAKLARLKILGKLIRGSRASDTDIDESVVIWLELFREVSDLPPFECVTTLIERYENPGKAFTIMAERLMDTLDIVEKYKAGDKSEKLRLKPVLKARGML